MSNSDEGNVRIRIAIDVPLGGGEPRVETTSTAKPIAPERAPPVGQARDSRSHFLGVNIPDADANAIWDPVKGTGYICAMGTTNDPEVCAVAAVVRPTHSPVTPDCIPSDALVSSINSGSGWQFTGDKILPGLVGYPYPTAHTLILWKIVRTSGGDQHWTLTEVFPFIAIWSDETDCGDGLPGEQKSAVQQFQPNQAPSVQNAAAGWKVSAAGFHGKEVAAFNGDHHLKLVQPAPRGVVYTSGGDGIHKPDIQLRCESACQPKWVLVFAMQGVAIQYTKPIENFQTNAVNVFSEATSMGLHAAVSMPSLVTLTPL